MLVDTEFVNANKLVRLENRRDVKGWIEILYIKSDKDVTLLAYHKIGLAIFWFINIIKYYQGLILAYFMCKWASESL